MTTFSELFDQQPPPWEPPLAGTEAEHLAGALDRMRWTFRYKADGLDAAQLQVRIGASALTLGGLLNHLARVEDELFGPKLTGAPMPEPWASLTGDTHDPEFASAAGDAPEELYSRYDGAVARSRAALAAFLADGDPGTPVHLGAKGAHASLRRLLCDAIEEYGRHTGHADLLREAVDGRVGEDPPNDWRP